MDIVRKIEMLRGRYDLTQKQLGEIAGVTGAAVSAWEQGDRSPKLGAIKLICARFGLDLKRFVDETDDYFGQEDAYPANVRPMPTIRRVPRLGSIACGEPILAEQNIEGYDEVPDWVHCDFSLTCKGDSMTGARIFDGDVVCVRKQEEVKNGEIAAVLIDGEEATLKRVRIIDGGLMLCPANDQYEPKIFTGADVNRVRILGLATHFISRVL